MLTNNFAAAINAREPLEISQDTAPVAVSDPGAQGNAFAGGRANADHEMYNAIHGAIMNGDTGGNSSIANAGMRLSAKFGSAASKSEKDAEKNRAAYIQVMMQQILADLDEKIAEMSDQINLLQNVLKDNDSALWSAENEKGLNSDEREALAIIVQEQDIENEEFFDLDADERRAAAREAEVSITERRQDFVDKRREIASMQDDNLELDVFIEPLPVENNIFLDEQYELAAQRIENDHGIDFDRHNISPENMNLLQDTIQLMEKEEIDKSLNISGDNPLNNETLSLIDSFSL